MHQNIEHKMEDIQSSVIISKAEYDRLLALECEYTGYRMAFEALRHTPVSMDTPILRGQRALDAALRCVGGLCDADAAVEAAKKFSAFLDGDA